MNISTFVYTFLALTISLICIQSHEASAKCVKYRNYNGNIEIKCDSIDEYPDYNRSDDHDINPSAWNRGHQAGSDWARQKGITSRSQCTGRSRSFVEGCMRAAGDD